MTPDEQKRVLKLESQLAQCQNALEAARRQIAQHQQRAKAKAKKERK
jgi:hypothetical protein